MMLYPSRVIITCLVCLVFLSSFADNNLNISKITIKDSIRTTESSFIYNSDNKEVVKFTVIDGLNTSLQETQYNFGQISQILNYIWLNNAWSLVKKTVCNSIDDHRTSTVISTLHLGTWSDSLQIIQSLQSGASAYTVSVWQNNRWNNYTKSESALDTTDSSALSTTCYTGSGTDWLPCKRVDYTYLSIKGRKLLSKVTVLQYDNGNFVNEGQTAYYYDTLNNVLKEQLSSVWSANKWQPAQRTVWSYDAISRLTYETMQIWEATYWKNMLRYNYLYDPKGYLTDKITQTYIYNAWRNMYISHMTNDADGNNINIASTELFWGGTQGNEHDTYIAYSAPALNTSGILWGNNVTISYASSIATASQEPDDKNTIRTAPNPSTTGIYHIDCGNKRLTGWRTFRLNGLPVKADHQMGQSTVVDLSDQPDGMYLLQIVTDAGSSCAKLIKKAR
jgi:hypothetical protein